MEQKKNYSLSLIIIVLATLGGCFGSGSTSSNSSIRMENLKDKENLMPIAVIGSGPAGLMAGLYGARGGKDTFVVQGNKPGGLLMDTTEVENWPGELAITGPQIMEKLTVQAKHHGVTFIDDAIERIDISRWPYRLYTENGDLFHALTIIIATGASPRRLGAIGEEEYWGVGVTSCAVCDAPFYKGLDVVVVGGGDSAVEEAIQLSSYAKKITILVRKGAMRAAARMQERLKNYPNISVTYNVQVQEIMGDGTLVTGVKLYNAQTKETIIMPTSGVFLAVGHDPNTAFVKDSVKTDNAGYIVVKGRTQETSMPGIFAAGDVEDNRYRQAGSSAGYGIDAGLDAVRFLDDQGYNPTIAQKMKKQLYKKEQPTQRGTDTTVVALENISQFNDFIKSKGVVVIDFWGQTCPSCKQMLPSFREVAYEYADRVGFATVDVDEQEGIAEKLFVHRVPCLLVFRNGDLIARYTDIMSRKELGAFIEQFIGQEGEKSL